jgi:hypothetical protein
VYATDYLGERAYEQASAVHDRVKEIDHVIADLVGIVDHIGEDLPGLFKGFRIGSFRLGDAQRRNGIDLPAVVFRVLPGCYHAVLDHAVQMHEQSGLSLSCEIHQFSGRKIPP